MAHNEETVGLKGEKDLDIPTIKAFDKEKLLAMQTQVVEEITQNKNSQQRFSGVRTTKETSSRSLEKYEKPWKCW